MLGTTDYVALEQAMGQSIDARSDVYSLGVLLYEMLTGEVPFHAETQVGVAMKHVNEPLPDVQSRRPEVSAAARGRRRGRNRQGPGRSLLGHGGDAARPESALEVEVSRAGKATGEVTTALDSVPPRRRIFTRRGMSIAGILLVLAAAAAAVAIVVATTLGASGGQAGGPRRPRGRTAPGGERLRPVGHRW